MKALVHHKEVATSLRRKGHSYSDILKEVPVAKSTLSSWLKDLPLSDTEKVYLKRRKDGNISRGRIRAASALHDRRLERDGQLFKQARESFDSFKHEPFFNIGIALYWAEGTKRNWGFAFTNSDPEMIVLMVKWIEIYLGVSRDLMRARLYTHKPFADNGQEEYWAQVSGIPFENFGKTIYKPTSKHVKKRPAYKGCLKIELNKASYLRLLMFWQQMMIEHYAKER